MNKFRMQTYLEDNLDRILESYFEWLDDFICEKAYDLEGFSKFIDDIAFYKEWSKDTKYKANIFLTEIEDEKEGEEISD